jgi:hypothetical protein
VSESTGPGMAPPERLNMTYHLIIGVAIGIVAVFTAFAWPFAIAVGMIIGLAGVERAKGIQQRGAVHMLRALGVVVGTIAMFILGAIIGGFISLIIVGLAAFSERVAGNTTATDRGIARILIGIVAVAIWFLVIFVGGFNVNIKFG